MERFMDTEITNKQVWYVVDGPMGTENVPADLVGDIDLVKHAREARGMVPEALKDYCQNREAWTIEKVRGYGVRESAPGYLDCTEWEVFNTLREATARASEIDEEYAEMDA